MTVKILFWWKEIHQIMNIWCALVVPISCLIGDTAKISLFLSGATYSRDLSAYEIFGMNGLVYSAFLYDKTQVSWTNYTPEKVALPNVMKCNQESIYSKYCYNLQKTIWSPLTAIVTDGCVFLLLFAKLILLTRNF